MEISNSRFHTGTTLLSRRLGCKTAERDVNDILQKPIWGAIYIIKRHDDVIIWRAVALLVFCEVNHRSLVTGGFTSQNAFYVEL